MHTCVCFVHRNISYYGFFFAKYVLLQEKQTKHRGIKFLELTVSKGIDSIYLVICLYMLPMLINISDAIKIFSGLVSQ